MASEDRIWLLISKSISGDITRSEVEELEIIFQDEPELRADCENLKKIRLEPKGIMSLEERRALERGIERFKLSLDEEDGFNDLPLFGVNQLKPLKRKNSKIWMVAASVIMILLASVYLLPRHKHNISNQQILSAQYGKRIHTVLPDGSSVWLNAGSSIKYAGNLIVNDKREILLNGEGYFDIKHDAKHPFIVHAGKLNIVVLGTAFNVKAYADDKYIETTLIRGKVEILNDNKPSSKIVLYPNEKICINTAQNKAKEVKIINKEPVADSVGKNTPVILPNENIVETSWVNNSLSFRKEEFTDLAKQLERWYNVEIIFDNDTYSAKQFTGTFKDQDITEVMRALQFTQPFHYTITNNQIHIW